MRTLDFSPLFHSTVGFDRMQRMLDSAQRVDVAKPSYPPYNIESVDEDSYRITMAVAGFANEDLDITVKENTLSGSGNSQRDEGDVVYLHRGIAGRSFERNFQLADHIKVVGAGLENGILQIDLVREVPEEMKPRKITIGTGAKVLEAAKTKAA